MASLKPSLYNDSAVPAEHAASFLRGHQARVDVTRSSMTVTDGFSGARAEFEVYRGEVESAPVLRFLGYLD